MNKFSKDPIDQFFKEALKSPDLKYNKQDWKGLEAMLPRKSKNKTIAWLLPAAAILLIFISLWLSDGTRTENKPISKTGFDSTIRDSKKTERKYSGNENPEKPNSLIPPSNTISQVKPSKKVFPSKSLSNNLNLFKTDQPANYKNGLLLQAQPVAIAQSLSTQNKRFNITEIYEINVLPKIIETADQTDEHKSEEKVNGRLSLALSVSPDINSVDHFASNDIGASIGVGASYKINKHLSFQAAIGYSKKVYSALPYEYKAPWANSNAAKYAESIDADCRVLDVPLSLRYTFASSPKKAFFLSGGLSSYFMLEETYTLIGKAQPGYPNTADATYSYKNKNNHPLSVANFSAGLSKPLNKQTSVVIQPYVKLPLTGIGQGKVNLQSTGIIFQLEYNLAKKKKFSPSGAAQ